MTKGKYADKVDKGQDMAKEQIKKMGNEVVISARVRAPQPDGSGARSHA